MSKELDYILKKQKIKIQLIGKINYNIFSEGQICKLSAGTIILVTKIKLNGKKTWLEFKGVLKEDPDKPIKFSIHPDNINSHLKILDI